MKTWLNVILALVAAAAPALAQPQLSNGELRPLTLPGGVSRAALDALAARSGTAWAGYAVPIVDGDHRMCCWSDDAGACCVGCRLEPGRGAAGATITTTAPGAVALESPRVMHVLYRLDGGRVERIRAFSADCALDAGGLTLHWMENVSGGDSVALLSSFLAAEGPRRLADGALHALALHREPAALDRLVREARQGASTHLRGQALFWLAQRAGDKAVGTISEAIARDPETEVKKRAVFALSQLPKDQGVPLLIEVARGNANPAVRRQAMFWLGQSRDPRALKFFEEILFK